MKAWGTVEVNAFDKNGMCDITVAQHDHDKFRAFLTTYNGRKTEEDTVDVRIYGAAKIISTSKGGKIALQFTEAPKFLAEKIYQHRTAAQISTLRGVERFIAWAQNGYEPSESDLYYIHEGLLAKYSKEEENPISDTVEIIRSSSPAMSTKIMAGIIHGALNELATTEIPKKVLDSIGEGMSSLWEAWHKWRYTNKDGDPLYEAEKGIKWDEYKELYPVCELCGLPGYFGSELQRMHIISKGRDETVYEESWNWLHVHPHHHQLQHAEGWGTIAHLFPHIKGKIDRAEKIYADLNSGRKKDS